MPPRPPQSRKENNGASTVCSLFNPVMRKNGREEVRAREANFVQDNFKEHVVTGTVEERFILFSTPRTNCLVLYHNVMVTQKINKL